jgi:CheY-like chemotaxis protein
MANVGARRSRSGAALASLMRGLRVLIVDEDDDARVALIGVVRHFGARAEAAQSVEAARAALARQRFDVVVCDLMSPEEDGCDLIADLRCWPIAAGGRTPAIALSGVDDAWACERAIAAGFQRVLCKPVQVKSLAQAVIEVAALVRAAAPAHRHSPLPS